MVKLFLAELVSKLQLTTPDSSFGAAFAVAWLWDGADHPAGRLRCEMKVAWSVMSIFSRVVLF